MKKIIQPQGIKDDSGAYIKVTPEQSNDYSIDGIMRDGLINIRRIMDKISSQTVFGMPERDVVSSLKDCMNMLMELKKKEQELLENMSDEELTKALKKLK